MPTLRKRHNSSCAQGSQSANIALVSTELSALNPCCAHSTHAHVCNMHQEVALHLGFLYFTCILHIMSTIMWCATLFTLCLVETRRELTIARVQRSKSANVQFQEAQRCKVTTMEGSACTYRCGELVGAHCTPLKCAGVFFVVLLSLSIFSTCSDDYLFCAYI